MADQHPKAYNDGICVLCRERAAPSSFAARRAPNSVEDLVELCTLAFHEQSCRMEDREYAQQMGYSLARKISTRRLGGIRVDTKCSARIGNVLYHIGAVEYTQTELYLHLAEVKQLA